MKCIERISIHRYRLLPPIETKLKRASQTKADKLGAKLLVLTRVYLRFPCNWLESRRCSKHQIAIFSDREPHSEPGPYGYRLSYSRLRPLLREPI